MAEKRQDLAKSMVASVPLSTVRCEVLYVQNGTSTQGLAFPEHAHPFWQVEIMQSGHLRCRTPGNELTLTSGDGVLLPANLPHAFHYDRMSRHVSFKFRVDGAAIPSHPIVLNDIPGWAAMSATLIALVEHPRPDYRRQHAVSHLLEALIALAVTPHPERASTPSLVEQVRSLVEHGENRRWTVAGIARALGCSAGHASAVFRTQSAMTLKSFLDQARQEAAANLLSNTDLPISDIAELLEFPDVFAFSRFIKRTASVSPKALRKQLR
jgi:AraC-like DNA-binding protein/quercetin dioxygenase-like cupin family protein